MTSAMPNILRTVGIRTESTGPVPTRSAVIAAKLARWLLLGGVAWSLGVYVGSGPGQGKLHGAIIGAVSFLFTLQEFLFFQTRNRLNETMKSTAVRTKDIDAMLERTLKMKSYLERVWVYSLTLKLFGVSLGALLFFELLKNTDINLRFVRLDAVRSASVVGWFAVLLAADFTFRTYRAYAHVDHVQSKLDADARQKTAAIEAVDELTKAPASDWRKDPSLSGYDRIPPPNTGRTK